MDLPDLCPLRCVRCNDRCAWYDPELGGCAVYVIGCVLAASLDYARERNGDAGDAGE